MTEAVHESWLIISNGISQTDIVEAIQEWWLVTIPDNMMTEATCES